MPSSGPTDDGKLGSLMGNKPFKGFKSQPAPPSKRVVQSLLDVMKDGNEYASLLDVFPEHMNVVNEIRRGMADVEQIRKRPLLVYAANVLYSKGDVPTGIVSADDLPFAEMVAQVDAGDTAVDVLVVTPGGVAQQVAQFVNRLRPRFDHVAYVVPHVAMSAGTIWVLSGDQIWMDERGSLGPIDPQVPGRDGRFLPAQALLSLIESIRVRGEERLKNGANPAWTDQMLLRNMDAKEIGDAHSFSMYSIQLAANYLENYKFRSWVTHQSGNAVTADQRKRRAAEITTKLCDRSQWKVHSHGISRDVLWNELQLKIDHPEQEDGFLRALRRFWALMYWVFDNATVVKMFLSQNYSVVRNVPQPGGLK